ncbi:hypothetical protein [Streptomyces sp. CBMA152]|uniref:hypothetical protein n=1 Tax=Streptomyces sp. CBMA152 TaxID=1896312 RepID=UPI0016616928|nr:hypothetical protein [Streptomyces sp. CBMA152]
MATVAPQEPKARRVPVKVLALTGAVVVLAGAVGTWLVLRSDGGGAQPSCATVGKNARIQKDLAPADTKGMNCPDLAAALKKAAASDGSGRHTLQQAGVMRDLINTLDDDFRDRSRADIAAPLRQTVADLLADYSTDVHTMLVHYVESAEYLKHAGPDGGPWRDDKGVVRMPVANQPLILVMRAVSDDPAAYATLRKAETARSADDLARITKTSSGADVSVPVNGTATAMGLLDGIADDVLAARSTSEATQWKADAVKGLSDADTSPVPAYSADPAHYITRTWERGAGSGGFPALGKQTESMVGILVKASGRSAESVAKPLSQVASSARVGKDWLDEALTNVGSPPKSLRK